MYFCLFSLCNLSSTWHDLQMVDQVRDHTLHPRVSVLVMTAEMRESSCCELPHHCQRSDVLEICCCLEPGTHCFHKSSVDMRTDRAPALYHLDNLKLSALRVSKLVSKVSGWWLFRVKSSKAAPHTYCSLSKGSHLLYRAHEHLGSARVCLEILRLCQPGCCASSFA